MVEVEWNTEDLRVFAKALGSDKDGRALKKQMQMQFDSITEGLRDRLRHEVAQIQGVGEYPADLAESLKFTTKLIGGPKARVAVVGEATSPFAKTKWREVGKFLNEGYLFHPAWGRWRKLPLPGYLRQEVPGAMNATTDALAKSEPNIREEILDVLNDYLDRLTEIRGMK